MSWSLKIARVAGIDVYLHFTFLLILAFYGWEGFLRGGLAGAFLTVIFTLLLFLCVLLHEFGHAFAALAFGIRTPDITLLPIGGVARLERMPRNPWQEFLIAIAGPMVNVVIALVLFLVLGGVIPFSRALQAGIRGDMLQQLMSINIWLVVFNLIPAFPMDGGRVLRALLATQMRHSQATLIAARVGQGIAFLFVIAGLFGIPAFVLGIANALGAGHLIAAMSGNPLLIFIAMFVFMGAQQELDYARLREAAQGLQVGDAMITRFETAPLALSAGDVPQFLLQSGQQIFPMVDGSLHLAGLLTRDDLAEAHRELPAKAPVSCKARNIPSVRPETSFEEALELMQQAGFPVLPVVDGSGQLVGLVAVDQLDTVRQMRRPA